MEWQNPQTAPHDRPILVRYIGFSMMSGAYYSAEVTKWDEKEKTGASTSVLIMPVVMADLIL